MKKRTRLLSLLLAVMFMLATFAPMSVFAQSENKDVATITVFSYASMFDKGHAWIYFENMSDETLTIGAYKLEPGKAVSVGTYSNTRKEGKGVYYNLDSYIVNHFNYKSRVSLTEGITKDEVKKLSNYINTHNTWSVSKNCSYFAEKMWNQVSTKKIKAAGTPSYLKTTIKKYNEQINKPMDNVSKKEVYRLKGSGDNTYLINMRESAIHKKF
ncbi:MAG: hypothetical protein ACI4W6_09975 [Acutalibacteraceae bacterium]